MIPHTTNEVSFSVDPSWQDQTVHILAGPVGPEETRFTLVVSKEPLNGRDPAAVVQGQADALAQRLRHFELLGQKKRTVGALPAWEIRITHVHQSKGVYQQQVFVQYYDMLVVFTVTDASARAQEARALLDLVLADAKFRKR